MIHATSIFAVLTCQVLLQGAADAYRANQAGRASEGLKLWPSGPFDPLGLAEDPDSLTELKAKETKNGRLAIMSMLAYAVQVIVPGEGPAENWAACTAHALGANGLSLALMGQITPSPVAMFAPCGHNAAEFSAWYGSDCSEWLDPERPTSVYVTGVYPGDYRWGIADLGADQITLDPYRKAERIHACWALLDIMGCLAPEILAKFTGSQLSGPAWFQTGAEIFKESRVNHASNPSLIHATSIFAVLTCRVLLQGAADAYRVNQAGRASEGLKLWSGGPFDPLGLAEDLDSLTELKAKETKNGRLAIISMLAYAVQVIVPGEGPAENWAACTAHALGANGLSLALMGQVTPSPLAIFAAYGHNAAEFSASYGSVCSEWLDPERPTSVYLTGLYPGDYRWGTADLGADQITLEQYRKAERIHARWALLDIMGCLALEVLAKFTSSQVSGPAWFQTGAEIFQEGRPNHASNPSLIHATSILPS